MASVPYSTVRYGTVPYNTQNEKLNGVISLFHYGTVQERQERQAQRQERQERINGENYQEHSCPFRSRLVQATLFRDRFGAERSK